MDKKGYLKEVLETTKEVMWEEVFLDGRGVSESLSIAKGIVMETCYMLKEMYQDVNKDVDAEDMYDYITESNEFKTMIDKFMVGEDDDKYAYLRERFLHCAKQDGEEHLWEENGIGVKYTHIPKTPSLYV